MTEPIVYVNGAFVPESEARISVLDHAVLYGDGIFETAFAWKGRVFKLDAHIDRGFLSMAAIALEPPMDREAMRSIILEAVRRNEFTDAYIKWIVTRGVNGEPLLDPTGCVPNLIVIVRPYISRVSADQLAAGLRLKTVAVRRQPGEVLDAHIKSLNYLNLALAKLEAKAAGADEALMLGIHGRISEATGCNFFPSIPGCSRGRCSRLRFHPPGPEIEEQHSGQTPNAVRLTIGDAVRSRAEFTQGLTTLRRVLDEFA